MNDFEKAIENIADYAQEIQEKYELSDKEMKDILDIVRQDYV